MFYVFVCLYVTVCVRVCACMCVSMCVCVCGVYMPACVRMHVGVSVLVILYSCEWMSVQSTRWTEASRWWSGARNSAKVRHSRSSVIAVHCTSPVLLCVTMGSIPVSVVLHSLERLLVSKEEREKIRRDKYLSRRGKVEQW